jgi:hypothetical protein
MVTLLAISPNRVTWSQKSEVRGRINWTGGQNWVGIKGLELEELKIRLGARYLGIEGQESLWV